ncbi:MAG: tetratricopeptide repeat protein [Pseudomonadota bacterium]
MRVLVWGLGAFAALWVAVPMEAAAQRGQTRERIEALEEQLRDLQGYIYGEDGATAPVRFEGADPEGRARIAGAQATDASLSPELSLRLSGLETEIQRLTGRVEEMSYAMQQQQLRMDRLVQLLYPDYDEQSNLGLLAQNELLSGRTREAPEAYAPPSSGPVDLVTGGSAAAAAGLPEFASASAAYSAGRSALFAGRFDEAERAFLALTENYPDSPEYGDGLFYLAETYRAQGDRRAAVTAYYNFIRSQPDSPRAAQAYLNLGQILGDAGNPKQACRVWLVGLQKVPDMDEEIRTQIEEQQVAYSCQGAPTPE